MAHDDNGCKHSSCSCKLSNRQTVPAVSDPASSQLDDVPGMIDRLWSFTREYPSVAPDALFGAIVKSLRDFPYFKFWKVDNDSRYIELTTHSIGFTPGVKYHQVQADLKVMEGRDPSSSTFIVRITPTLIGALSRYEIFTNVDVNDKFANHVASLIFGELEKGYHSS